MMELSPHFLVSPVGGAHLCSAFYGRTCVVGHIFNPHDGAYPFLEGPHMYVLHLDCRSAYRLQPRAVGWHVARPSGVLAEEGWLSCRLVRSYGPLDQELSADIWSLGRVHSTCLTFFRGFQTKSHAWQDRGFCQTWIHCHAHGVHSGTLLEGNENCWLQVGRAGAGTQPAKRELLTRSSARGTLQWQVYCVCYCFCCSGRDSSTAVLPCANPPVQHMTGATVLRTQNCG